MGIETEARQNSCRPSWPPLSVRFAHCKQPTVVQFGRHGQIVESAWDSFTQILKPSTQPILKSLLRKAN